MPKVLEPPTNQRLFILEALKQDLRLDGRAFDSFRPLKLQFGRELGLADVRLGQTRVIARVSAEIVQPFQDRPFDGIFTITTELGTMASAVFEAGRQTEQEVLLARSIEKSIRRSNAIDSESLCIVGGQKCWHIRADVHFLNHDGGLIDASCIAVVAALQHFRCPEVSVEGQRVTVHALNKRVPMPLSVLHVPICVSFSYFGREWDATLVDATLQEEQLRDGDMTITLNRYGDVCQIAKAGGLPMEASALHHCLQMALVKAEDITALLAQCLKEDEVERTRRDGLLESTAENDRT